MSSLKSKNISELVDVFNNVRVPLSAKEREKLEKKYPYYGAQSIVDYVDNYLFDGEYILIAEDGENLKSNNQNICNLVNGKFWVNNHAHIVKANTFNDTKYLFYNFNRIKFEPYVTGSAQPKLNKENLLNIKTYVHDLIDQKKIAKVLSDLDAKIELNNKINAALEAMAKTLYDYWFVQFDFPNANGKPYKSSGGKMVYNEELKREIPEGWDNRTFGNYCKSTGGFAFKSSWWGDKGLKVVKIKDIEENNTINLNNLSLANISFDKIDDKFLAKPGNVLIAMTGATVGKFAIIPITLEPLYVNQRVGYFNLGKEPIKRLSFLINSLNQVYFREAIFTLASGAAQPNISNEQINDIQLLFPSKELIEKFNQILSPNYTKILINQKENQELASLRDWLLPMLMNGQVSVGDVEEELGMVAEPSVEYKNN